MKDAALGRTGRACTWTLRMRFTGSASKQFARSTAICSISIERITGEDAYTVPMRIYPAPHYTMGGLWVDYHLMSTIPGLVRGR